jgi:hypothetical protein
MGDSFVTPLALRSLDAEIIQRNTEISNISVKPPKNYKNLAKA